MHRLIAATSFFIFITLNLNAQSYLSNLEAARNDPVFTTYAAPLQRSQYKIDQGYEFLWYDPEKNVCFQSKDGGTIGVVFAKAEVLRSRLAEYFKEPIITASYNDMVKYFYYPFKDVRVNVFFDVYSSSVAIMEVELVNEGNIPVEIKVYPYYAHTDGKIENANYYDASKTFSFNYYKERDGWMKEHSIPLVENLRSFFLIDQNVPSFGGYRNFDKDSVSFLNNILHSNKFMSEVKPDSRIFSWELHISLKPEESYTLKIIRGLQDVHSDPDELIEKCKNLFSYDLNQSIIDDEEVYSKIPRLFFGNQNYQLLYWNAFSLIRQCMMPPEGECGYNYYVFSREPKWGWGYGGQVFHESLVMLAYAYMDPVSAMNSQRVYMERQWDNGYINYRTGPYLNETIEYNNQYTSSAPWYNYQNLEIYKITGDKKFLEEAYKSGKKFYEYYVTNRDTDNDGLCEWGAHAELECVRDARVAVWDRVGWPANFEGVDLNCMLVSEAKSLSEMAGILGLSEESEKWKIDEEKRAELINKYMWDDETGFYYNIDKNDNDFSFNQTEDLKIKEIIGFLPLWAGIAPKDRAEQLLKIMNDPEEFGRAFGVPTLTAKDDYYNPIGYWNGPIWIQWQYLIFRGLLNYGYEKEAAQLADKVMDNVIHQLKIDHCFWEFYSADDYQAGWNKTYIWTGLVARMLIDINNLNNKLKSSGNQNE